MKNVVAVVIILIVLVVAGMLLFGGKGVDVNVDIDATSNSTQPIADEATPIGDMSAEGGATVGEYQSPVVGEEAPVKEFTVTGQNFSFTPSAMTVQKGDKVKITFKNTGGFHDFVIDEYGVATKQAQSPATEVVEFVADKAGTFEFYCSVGNHRAMGMKGALTVE